MPLSRPRRAMNAGDIAAQVISGTEPIPPRASPEMERRLGSEGGLRFLVRQAFALCHRLHEDSTVAVGQLRGELGKRDARKMPLLFEDLGMDQKRTSDPGGDLPFARSDGESDEADLARGMRVGYQRLRSPGSPANPSPSALRRGERYTARALSPTNRLPQTRCISSSLLMIAGHCSTSISKRS
jgi:hypothetical protein